MKQQLLKIRTSSKYLLFATVAMAALTLSACQMIADPALLESQPVAMATETPVEEAAATEDEAAEEPAMEETAATEEEAAEEPAMEEAAATEDEAAEEPAMEEAAATEDEAAEEPAMEEAAATEDEAAEEPAMEEAAATEDEAAEEPAMEEVTETAPSNSSSSSAPLIPGVEPAKATVNIPSLRVHEEPSDNSEVIASISEGETYKVAGISSTGIWILLEFPEMPEGTGWVSANFVTLEGDITNIAIIEVEVAAATDEVMTEDTTSDDATAEVTSTDDSTVDVTDAETTITEGPRATINTRSLRVRDAPSENGEVIAGVREGETYRVLEVSSDGLWVRFEIPRAPAGVGWVAAEFVDMQDDSEENMTPVATETETDADSTSDDTPAEQASTDEPVEDPGDEPVIQVDAGFALVSSDLPLRVRSAPTTEEENKVGNVFDGEIYRVLEISADGFWVRIEVPQLELEDGGWVSAEYLILGTE